MKASLPFMSHLSIASHFGPQGTLHSPCDYSQSASCWQSARTWRLHGPSWQGWVRAWVICLASFRHCGHCLRVLTQPLVTR